MDWEYVTPRLKAVRRKNMKKTTVLFCALFLWADCFLCADVLVIAHPDTPLSSLEKKEVKDIFTGKKTRWDGKLKVVIATLKNSEIHRQFLGKFIKKTPAQFRNYWRRKVFTGEGKSPKSFKNEAELIAYIAKTKGAVGYISTASAVKDKAVKRITIDNGHGGNK
jgi:ABC-type phosphate transport system substrate-binding protein